MSKWIRLIDWISCEINIKVRHIWYWWAMHGHPQLDSVMDTIINCAKTCISLMCRWMRSKTTHRRTSMFALKNETIIRLATWVVTKAGPNPNTVSTRSDHKGGISSLNANPPSTNKAHCLHIETNKSETEEYACKAYTHAQWKITRFWGTQLNLESQNKREA